MSTRFVAVGGLLAGLMIFAWGAISNTLLPPPRSFLSDSATVAFMRAQAPENGVYFAPQGVFAAVSISPDMRDRSANITPMLIRQLMTDVVTAMLLAFALGMTPVRRYASAAGFFALVGVAAGIGQTFPLWNWYGFPPGDVLREMADLVVGWVLAAMVLVALRRGFERAPEA